VVGRDIRLNGVPHTVVGIMPATFDFTASSEELWTPAAFTPKQLGQHDEHLTMVARSRTGDASALTSVARGHDNRSADVRRSNCRSRRGRAGRDDDSGAPRGPRRFDAGAEFRIGIKVRPARTRRGTTLY
jgi:hypothetical protein